MHRNNYVYLILIFIVSCKQKIIKPNTVEEINKFAVDNFNSLDDDDDDDDFQISGNLTLDSKGIALVDFSDTIYNGKIRVIGTKGLYEEIYTNYDAFLSMKNSDDSECTVFISGHYIKPIDTTSWAHDRRDFYVNTVSYLF